MSTYSFCPFCFQGSFPVHFPHPFYLSIHFLQVPAFPCFLFLVLTSTSSSNSLFCRHPSRFHFSPPRPPAPPHLHLFRRVFHQFFPNSTKTPFVWWGPLLLHHQDQDQEKPNSPAKIPKLCGQTTNHEDKLLVNGVYQTLSKQEHPLQITLVHAFFQDTVWQNHVTKNCSKLMCISCRIGRKWNGGLREHKTECPDNKNRLVEDISWPSGY